MLVVDGSPTCAVSYGALLPCIIPTGENIELYICSYTISIDNYPPEHIDKFRNEKQQIPTKTSNGCVASTILLL